MGGNRVDDGWELTGYIWSRDKQHNDEVLRGERLSCVRLLRRAMWDNILNMILKYLLQQ